MAVHSLKDVPAVLPDGFHLSVVGSRGDVRDALVGAKDLLALPQTARIGTSSTRRAAQLLRHNRQLDIVTVRGNVQTRLRKLDDGSVDALILASAGLDRLGLSARIGSRLDTRLCLPAAAQGALAAEYRSDRSDVAASLAAISDDETRICVTAERDVVAGVAGDCTMPIGAHCAREGDAYQLEAALFSPSDRCLRVRLRGTEASKLGSEAAKRLVDLGAAEIIEQSRTLSG